MAMQALGFGSRGRHSASAQCTTARSELTLRPGQDPPATMTKRQAHVSNPTQTLAPTAAPVLPASHTHQLLTAIATELDAGHPFLVLTPNVLGEAIETAMALTVDGLPQLVRDTALAGAMAAGATNLLPNVTAGEHAIILRAAARHL